MRIRSFGLGVVVLSVLACWPTAALADNTTCANADFLFMGVARGQDITNGTSRYYKVRVVEGRSYSVYSWSPFADVGEGSANVSHVLYSDAACATLATTSSNVEKEPTVNTIGHRSDNDTVIPTFTGTMYIRVNNLADSTQIIYTAIQETTIFSPWWFVAGSNNAFAEIKSAVNGVIAYTLTAYTASGAVCGSVSDTLYANGNAAINIRTLGTCLAAGSGSAQVAFQGPPGAVIGNITTLDATTGLSFDAPFTPRMPWAISTQ